MSIKIFHTGDIHLGKKFNNYPEQVREELTEARFRVLDRMISKANDLDSNLFVIAGDLFNTIRISKKDILKTIESLDKFSGECVIILPGNHDYDNGSIKLWQDISTISNIKSDKILLANQERKYYLKDYGLAAVIYPAPCHSKHSAENSLGWIKEERNFDENLLHIGVAHGAIEGLSPDLEGNYYYMSMQELNSIPLDLWLLGHTHVSYPFYEATKGDKIFNAGTPEPDGLDYKHPGAAWSIMLSKDKVEGEKITTGEYRFYDEDFKISSEEDFARIQGWIEKSNPSKAVLRLNLQGSIPNEIYENLNEFYRKLERSLFHLIVEDTDLKILITEEMIAEEFPEASFPYEFLKGLTHDKEALQIAYELLTNKGGQ